MVRDLPIQERPRLTEEAAAAMAPAINEALDKIEYSTIVGAYQVICISFLAPVFTCMIVLHHARLVESILFSVSVPTPI